MLAARSPAAKAPAPAGKAPAPAPAAAPASAGQVWRALAVGGGTGPASAPSDVVDEALREDAGEPLDGATRAFFQLRLARDLGNVRVHTGEGAAASADALAANAYTVGAHI